MIDRALAILTKYAPIRLWALFGAGVVLTLGAASLVLIVWLGHWPPELAELRLRILGIATVMLIAGMLIVSVSLAAVRFNARGPGGISLDIEGGGDTTAARVTTTVEVPKETK